MIRTLALAAIACGLHACTTTGPAEEAGAAAHQAQAWKLAHALVGDWIDSTSSDTFVVHETWRAVNDSTLEGRGHVLAGKDTVFIEALRLQRRNGAVIYAALPGGEANGTFTDFACSHATADTLVFTNPVNDFPKRIRYVRERNGWHAVIDEDRKGPQRSEGFHFGPR
ncbi:MAG: hypothetical protein JNJ64_01845 [Flavobacteriales bacterium]|nr:hypothetical protein [Flavobacteriales bacterium]